MKDEGLRISRTPILVENLDSVFSGDGAHVLVPFDATAANLLPATARQESELPHGTSERRKVNMKHGTEGINPSAEPSGTGCVECMEEGSWWFHLRRCAESVISVAATALRIDTHPNITRPQLIRSHNFEPGGVGSTIIARKSFLSDLASPPAVSSCGSTHPRASGPSTDKLASASLGDRIQNSTKIRGRV